MSPPPILSPGLFWTLLRTKEAPFIFLPKPHLSVITLPVLSQVVSFWFFVYPFIFMTIVSLSRTVQSLRCSWLCRDLQSKYQTNAASQLNFHLLFWGNQLIELSRRGTCRALSERPKDYATAEAPQMRGQIQTSFPDNPYRPHHT